MPSPPDRLYSSVVRINGEEAPDFLKCIQSLKVEEDLRQGSSFEIVVNVCRNDDGSYPHIGENDAVTAWSRMTITVSVASARDVIMDGYLSDLHISTTPQTQTLSAAFVGVDASFVMNLDEHCQVWSGLAYEDVARKIIARYGFNPVVADPPAGGSNPPPSVTQRCTDLRFLRELARRRGYEFYVKGGNAYFGRPNLEVAPQKLIAINFGDQTNCSDLQVSADFTQPTEVVVTRQDPESGQPQAVRADDSGLLPLGSSALKDRRGYGVPPARVVARRAPIATEQDLTDYARGFMSNHGFWLRARGRLNALRYGAILRAGKPVTVKGVGREYEGIYYVRRVVHNLTSRSYDMDFEAYRNRSGQSGKEDYTGEDPGATQIPAAGPGADPDVITVRTGGPQVAPA